MTEQERREAQGKRVRMARAGVNLSRQKMADEVSMRWEKISREYIRRIEEGDVDPGYGFFLAAAEITGQTTEWFTKVDENPIIHAVSGSEWFPRPIDANAQATRFKAA